MTLSIGDLLIVGYPFYCTCNALRAPSRIKKQEFVSLAQMWHVVATVLCLDALTFGCIPLMDVFKTTMVAASCFEPTKTVSYDVSRYIVDKSKAIVLPYAKNALQYIPGALRCLQKVQNWINDQTGSRQRQIQVAATTAVSTTISATEQVN